MGEAAPVLGLAEPVEVPEVVLDVPVVAAATVVPNPLEDGRGTVAVGTVPVDVPVDVVDVVLVVSPAIEKDPLVEYTVLILEISTASIVYPSPAGTWGNDSVSVPSDDCTLLAMPNELWKTVFKR